MKRFGAKLHAKSLAAVSFILLIATLMSCLLAFPASAAEHSHSTWEELYYETDNVINYVGKGSDTFIVDTSSLSMRWYGNTRAYSANSIKSGSVQVAVWYMADSGYYTLFDETSSSQGTVQGSEKIYYTSGSKSYSDPKIFPELVNYGVMGMVNYMHSLKETSGNNTSGNYYITFGMSTRTSEPSFVNHY